MAAASFERLVTGWLGTFASPNTRDAYGRDLAVFGRWAVAVGLDARHARQADIEAFRDHCLAVGTGAATVNRRMAAVTSFYRHVGGRWGDVNPAAGAARADVAGSVSAAALPAAAAAAVWAAAGRLGSKSQVIVGLALFDGWRGGDLLALDVADVGGTRQAVTVSGTPVDVRTGAVLRAHLGRRTEGPLLLGENPTRESSRLTRHGVDYLVKRVGREAGLATPLTVSALVATQRAAAAEAPRPTR